MTGTTPSSLAANAQALEHELQWLSHLLQALQGPSGWANFVREHALGARERAVLMLACTPRCGKG